MANTGYFNTTAYDSRCIQFKWTIISQSIEKNETRIAWSITAEGRGKYSQYNAGNFKVLINGAEVYFSSKRITTTPGLKIAEGEQTLSHKDDGTCSFTAYAEAGIYTYAVNCTGSATFTLDTIPRAAKITAAPDFNDEENPTINYTNLAGSVVTALEACISLDGAADDVAYRAIPIAGTSYTFKLTEAERNVLRNATAGNSRTVIFYVRTTINGVKYHETAYKTLTIVNADPIIDPHIMDDNEATYNLTGGEALIRYFSDATFETGARAQKGATLTSQSVTCGGVTIKEATGTFPGVLSGSFVFTATDSRGNTTTLPVEVPFVDYIKLSCSIGNNKPDTDGNFTLVASGTCFNGDIASAGSNDLYVLYRYKASGGAFSDWMDMSISKGDNAYTATANFTGLDYRTTYIFQCRAGDLVTTATTDEVAIKAIPVFDWSGEDFNFNVPVKAPSLEVEEIHLDGTQLDYIVEQGVKSSWLYRKWNSGVMECWRRVQVTTNVSTAWGNLYSSGAISATNLTYPYPFIETPYLTANLMPFGSGGLLMVPGNQYGSATQTGAFEITRGSSITNSQYLIAYHAVGKWK
jgi:hypothetical protein